MTKFMVRLVLLSASFIFFQIQLSSQFILSGYVSGSTTVVNNPLIRYSEGFAPEVQIGWFFHDNYFIAFDYQRCFWFNQDPFINKIRSSIFEFKVGFKKPCKMHALFYNLGIGRNFNQIYFDRDETPEYIRKYQQDFQWHSLGFTLQAEFEHKRGFLSRLGYRHFFGTELLPAHKFGTIEVAFGYRIKFDPN